MANIEQVTELRRKIAEPTNSAPYTDDDLSVRIDGAVNIDMLAADIWREKAAGFASLVNVTEGSSSRALGSLQANALAMAKQFDEQGGEGFVAGGRVTRTRDIDRV